MSKKVCIEWPVVLICIKRERQQLSQGFFMRYDSDGEFMKKIKDWRYGLRMCGWDTDIIQIAWFLSHEVKEFYPMNKVPESVVRSLELLRERFNIARDQLDLTLDVIINEIEIDNLKSE